MIDRLTLFLVVAIDFRIVVRLIAIVLRTFLIDICFEFRDGPASSFSKIEYIVRK